MARGPRHERSRTHQGHGRHSGGGNFRRRNDGPINPPHIDAELLRQLDREEPLSMAEDPLSSVVLGAGQMLADFGLLRKISME